MKFLILRPQPRKTGKAKAKQGLRVFLEDGTELTGIQGLQLSGEPEWDYWPRRAITDPLRPPDRVVPTKLVIEFGHPDIEDITEPPKKTQPRQEVARKENP